MANSSGQSPKRKSWVKEFRAWVQLLAAIAIPVVIAVFGYNQNLTSLQLSDKQHSNDQSIAEDQQRESTLKTYLDDMSTLLLQDNLRNSRSTDEVRQIARAKTLATLSQLDGQRKGLVVRFLYETGLISVSTEGPIVNLYNADLSGANLYGGDLEGINLVRANLYRANLSDGNLSKANLSYTNLNEANLKRANLRDSILGLAHIVHADLRGADLTGAYWYVYGKPRVLITTQLLEQQSPLLSGAIMPDGSKHP